MNISYSNLRNFLCGIVLACALTLPLAAQTYSYVLSWEHAASHLYNVELMTAAATGAASDFQVAAWRPGRYYLQDYAAGIMNFKATDEKGTPLDWQKTDNNTWRVQNPAGGQIKISYQFFANTMDAGSSVLNNTQAYFNPVNFFMHLRNEYERPCLLSVPSMPENWKVASALKRVEGKHNQFSAIDFHEFADSPTILSPTLLTLDRQISETHFYFHFQGEFKGGKATEDAFLENMQKIVLEQRAIFGEFPMAEYHFIYQLLPYNMGHAVEHKNSACFAMPNTVGQSPAAIARLNSISAHEFFHLWNVKRIRPGLMWPYDYQKEAFTRLHWFTEGVTDYYTSLTLARAGLYSQETFFSIIARTIQALENNYASQYISPSQASFDAWLERSNYTPPFGHISYYTLGTRVGLLLDLKIRAATEGKMSLDDVFANLYKNYFKQDKGIEETAVQKAVEAIAGPTLNAFFDAHVNGTKAINYADFFAPFGLELEEKPIGKAEWQNVGIEKSQITNDGLYIESVRPGTDICAAGIGDKMLIYEINGKPFADFDAAAYFEKFKKAKPLTLSVGTESEAFKTELIWTGTWVPKNYALKLIEKPKDAQKALLNSWLKSRQ